MRATRAEVLAALDQMALTPVRVSEKEAAPAAGGSRRRVPLRRVRSRDITVFSRQLPNFLDDVFRVAPFVTAT